MVHHYVIPGAGPRVPGQGGGPEHRGPEHHIYIYITTTTTNNNDTIITPRSGPKQRHTWLQCYRCYCYYYWYYIYY